jgi:hypothetical protein
VALALAIFIAVFFAGIRLLLRRDHG